MNDDKENIRNTKYLYINKINEIKLEANSDSEENNKGDES